MAAKQLMLPANRAFNSNGLAISGAQAKLYLSGGLTPANFFADSGLVTSLGATLTANGAGRFPTAYGDSTVGYRLRTLDSDGAVLDDIDPYFFGLTTGVDGANASIAVGTTTTGAAGSSATVSNSGTGTNAILNFTVPAGTNGTNGATGPAGDVAKATDRTALAAITGQAGGATRFLVESGREGSFVWSTANNSANVTNDPAQALYVAPASDTTGASGAWVRKYNGGKQSGWFGAIGDGTTDDAIPLQRWLDHGGNLRGVGATYRSSATLIVRRTVELDGDCYGADDFRSSAGTLTPSFIIKFDAGVPGFDIQPQVSATTFPLGAATQEGAYNSRIVNVSLVGQGGATATGIYCRTLLHFDNVWVRNFSGKGFDVSASVASDATSEYGDASLSTLSNCKSISNGGDGYRLRGSDANIIKIDTCTAQLNSGWGFNDSTWVGGNKYHNCHATQNAGGSYAGGNTTASAAAQHVYDHCYVEGATSPNCDLGNECVVIGGLLSSYAFTNNNATTGRPTIIGNDRTVLKAVHVQDVGFGSGSATIHTNDYGLIAGSGTDGLTIQGRDGTDGSVGFRNLAGNPLGWFAGDGAGYAFRWGQTGATAFLDNQKPGTGYGPLNIRGAGVSILGDGSTTTFTADGTTLNLGAGISLKFNSTTVINSSGVLQASAVPAFAGGDVTSAGGSLTLSIGANKVTRAMLAATSGAAVLGTTAAGNVTDLTTLPAAVMPAHTGDVTSSAGAVALTVAANAVTYAKFNQVAASSLVGNPTGSLANAQGITLAGGLAFSGTTLTAAGALTPTSLASTGAVTSSSATAGIGYASGSRGTVTQATSKATGATSNTVVTDITLNAAALASATTVSFVFTNSAITANDTLILNHVTTGTFGSYTLNAHGFSAGSCTIDVRNISAGSLSEAIVIRAVLVKGG